VEASVGEQTSSSLIETPYVVIWKLVDPEPGNWRVDVTGIEGAFSAWNFASNKYSIALESFGAVPVNEPATIGAYVTDGTRNVAPEGATVFARITNPDGATFVHELNDRGVQGDAAAGDGFFAATLPPLSTSGNYIVDLELSWPQFNHKISTRSSFTAQAFPTISVTPVDVGQIQPGQRAKIATLFLNIQGEPYAVSRDQIIADIAFDGEIDVSKVLEINPTRILDQGRAWEYEVFLTPESDGFHTTVFRLDLEYAGKQRITSTQPIIVSSRSPAPPPQPVVPPPPAQQPPPPAVMPPPAGFPWAFMAIPAVAVVGLIAVFVNWAVRPRPYGYLYNDQNELVVDFSKVTRNPLKALLFKNSVAGRELGVQGLEDVSFEFSGGDVDLRSKQLSPT
ncbi:MAG: choice-of-anchor X domain-containing protein, partial [Ardenticatenaceae bacterium]